MANRNNRFGMQAVDAEGTFSKMIKGYAENKVAAGKTKKLVKKQKVQEEELQQERVKSSREEQYAKLEKSKSENEKKVMHTNERNRLEEAMILSEIVGLPRSKSRRSRGNRRGYGC